MNITRIKATNYIIGFFKNLRLEGNINGTALAEQMGKAKSYISILEKQNIEYIKIGDFRNLVSILLPEVTLNLTNDTLLTMSKIINENSGDMNKVLGEIKNLSAPKFEMDLFLEELTKQRHYRNLSLGDLESKCDLENGTIDKIIKLEVSDKYCAYDVLKKIFSELGFIANKMMNTFLYMLGVPIPSDTKIAKIKDINLCYEIDNDLPYNTSSKIKTWGEFLDWQEFQYNNMETPEDVEDRLNYEMELFNQENFRRQQYPENRKQELIDKINQSADVLKSFVNKIDICDYSNTNGIERHLQTLIDLLLTRDGMKIFEYLFSYPLQKISPVDLKEIIHFINSKLEYRYVFINEVPDKNSCNLEDHCDEYIHLECTYKDDVWGELHESLKDEDLY